MLFHVVSACGCFDRRIIMFLFVPFKVWICPLDFMNLASLFSFICFLTAFSTYGNLYRNSSIVWISDCRISFLLSRVVISFRLFQLLLIYDDFFLTYFFYSSHERTTDDLETIYEELLHIKALSHLSNSVKRELSSVIVFEAHPKASTICKPIRTAQLLNRYTWILNFSSVPSGRWRKIMVYNSPRIRRRRYTWQRNCYDTAWRGRFWKACPY